MKWNMMSKIDAQEITNAWESMSSKEFGSMVDSWKNGAINLELGEEYKLLRSRILLAYNESEKEIEAHAEYKSKKDYFKDLLFACRLHSILADFKFDVRLASNDQIWIYLGVVVLPDIVYCRWYPNLINQNDDKQTIVKINKDRFWKKSRRIYLKVLWWYIYLSMVFKEDGTEDIEETFEILKGNNTDTISQLVERSGVAGYRVNVLREIMFYYNSTRGKYKTGKFRRVMVLNTARVKIIEPELVQGGVKKYVKGLFEFGV